MGKTLTTLLSALDGRQVWISRCRLGDVIVMSATGGPEVPRGDDPGRPDAREAAPSMGEDEGGRKALAETGWIRRAVRWLTVDRVVTLALVLVAAFLLARPQRYLLTPPTDFIPPGDAAVPAPEFLLAGLEGRQVTLSDHLGQVILLNFWATWCPPCKAEMPSMEAAWRAHRERGFVILAVAEDRSGVAVVGPYVRERGVTFPVLLDPEGEVAARYAVRGLPTTYLIDRQGRIRSREIGAKDWAGSDAKRLIDRLLGEEPPLAPGPSFAPRGVARGGPS